MQKHPLFFKLHYPAAYSRVGFYNATSGYSKVADSKSVLPR